MKKLPNAVKWLIIVAVLAAMAAMTFAVNDRASRVDMPKKPCVVVAVCSSRENGAASGWPPLLHSTRPPQ